MVIDFTTSSLKGISAIKGGRCDARERLPCSKGHARGRARLRRWKRDRQRLEPRVSLVRLQPRLLRSRVRERPRIHHRRPAAPPRAACGGGAWGSLGQSVVRSGLHGHVCRRTGRTHFGCPHVHVAP